MKAVKTNLFCIIKKAYDNKVSLLISVFIFFINYFKMKAVKTNFNQESI